jgi:WD40 repeat protein
MSLRVEAEPAAGERQEDSMRRRLMCGLLAVVTGVAVTAVGADGARASLGVSRSLGWAGAHGLRPGPGSRLWVARYVGSGHNAVAYSVAVSPGGGTVFVTGRSDEGGRSFVDYATVAYNAAAGAQRWAARYTGPAGASESWDAASSVTVSPTGQAVYVTGVSQGINSGLDYATVAYNAATGARLWVKRYNGPANGDDGATSVAVSPGGGTVFVTGYSQGTRSGLDYATVAYNAATGAQRWAERYTGPGNGDDYAQSLAVSPSGRVVYVTGQSKVAASNVAAAYATVAINAATGTQRWAERYHGPATGEDTAHSVAVSPDGRMVYVTGASKATTTFLDYDYATVAYDAATGAQRWAARYRGPVQSYDTALSLAVSPSGTMVYITGQNQGPTSGDDYATVAYDAATGAQRWAARYNGPGNGDDVATTVAVSPGGASVYVAGYSIRKASGLASAYATIAYNATTGAQRWAARYNGPAPGVDVANSLAVSPGTGTVYVTGNASDAYATVAYHP